MKKKSTGPVNEKAKREIAKLKKLYDARVNFSDIPLQDSNDPKWQSAVIGEFYRPIKQPIALRIDADVLSWLKSQGSGYQARINGILRREMIAASKHKTLP